MAPSTFPSISPTNEPTSLYGSDWTNAWDGDTRVITSSFDPDPRDDRTVKRGSGSIELGNDLCIMKGSPRLYVNKVEGDDGFENVEMTAYGKFENFGTLKSYSGLTMAVRTSHALYKEDGCKAAGYYARIYALTGEASFQVSVIS